MKTHVFKTLFFALLALMLPHLTLAQSDRDSWQQPIKIMDVVGIKPGMVIGEAGAGDGYFTFFLSERVGESGHVYANDIVKSKLRSIERQCDRDSITNITTILGEPDDPLFPNNKLDMVVMMRVFHHIMEPETWMKNVIPSMKPGASVVIIDQDPDKTGRRRDHFMTREQVLDAMAETDFKLDRIETFLERDNIYVFSLKN